MKISAKKKQQFKKTVTDFYKKNKRNFPWRNTTDPYKIFISELMLQQTQADRVIDKFNAFIRQYPNVTKLAAASKADVLRMWQGLGYNRRALYVLLGAKMIVSDWDGTIAENNNLQDLPGVGPYTAAAISVFAFNKPYLVIETNIRSVYLYHFFKGRSDISDAEILPLIEVTMNKKSPREWFSALMDYGSYIKKTYSNPNIRSKHYTKQTPFKNSNRYIRGKVLQLLLHSGPLKKSEIRKELSVATASLDQALRQLIKEKLISLQDNRYHVE